MYTIRRIREHSGRNGLAAEYFSKRNIRIDDEERVLRDMKKILAIMRDFDV